MENRILFKFNIILILETAFILLSYLKFNYKAISKSILIVVDIIKSIKRLLT